MIIHFAAARKSIRHDIETLRQIVVAVHEQGHVIARDWVEPFYASEQKGLDDVTSEELYKLSMDAIARADLIIIEASEISFGSGFQVATALARKKPVLILVNSAKNNTNSTLLKGISDPLLKRVEYTPATLKKCVTEFIQENTISTKDLRFNFVIDRQIYNHIRWKSFKTHKTKAEVVRELLLRDLEKEE